MTSAKCRCDSPEHGHEPNKCSADPSAIGDGLCKECSEKISLTMDAIGTPLSTPQMPSR